MENNDELNLDELDQIEANADNKLKVKNRIQQLSEKTRLAYQEKEAAEAKAQAEADRADALEKQAQFYKGFSQLSSKYPEAANFQEQILERVNKGYDQEDAVIAVLGKEGKLGAQPIAPQPQMRPMSAEGGSAITNVSDDNKPELSTSDKLAALQELEKSGELQAALRAGINRS